MGKNKYRKIPLKEHYLFISAVAVWLLFFHMDTINLEAVYMIVCTSCVFLGFYFFDKYYRYISKWRIGLLISYALLLAATIIVGEKIKIDSRIFESFSLWDVLWLLCAIWIVFGCTVFVLWLIENEILAEIIFQDTGYMNKKNLIKLFIAFVVIYSCYLIIYAPGIVAGDSLSSIRQIEEGFLENHHPVFYTCIIGFFLKIGNYIGDNNTGILLYCIFQIVITSLTYSYFINWLGKRKIGKVCRIFVFLYYVFSPVFAIYSITLWKDPMFSCGLLMMIIKLFDFCNKESISKRELFCFSILGILISLLRNNGIYIFILTFILMLFFIRGNNKKIVLSILPAIILVYIITGPVYVNVLHANTRFVEKIGIPLQQMGRVVVENGEMSEEDEMFMYSLLPKEKWDTYYDPFIVDPVKWSKEFNTEYLNSHKKEFFDTWISMLKKNLKIYIQQYIMGTTGFWRIGEERSNEFVKLEILKNKYNIFSKSLLGDKTGTLIKNKLQNKYAHIPMGIFIWIIILDILFCLVYKKTEYILPLAPLIGNWGTLMIATPTAFGLRYIWINVLAFPLAILYPFLVSRLSRTRLREAAVN